MKIKKFLSNGAVVLPTCLFITFCKQQSNLNDSSNKSIVIEDNKKVAKVKAWATNRDAQGELDLYYMTCDNSSCSIGNLSTATATVAEFRELLLKEFDNNSPTYDLIMQFLLRSSVITDAQSPDSARVIKFLHAYINSRIEENARVEAEKQSYREMVLAETIADYNVYNNDLTSISKIDCVGGIISWTAVKVSASKLFAGNSCDVKYYHKSLDKEINRGADSCLSIAILQPPIKSELERSSNEATPSKYKTFGCAVSDNNKWRAFQLTKEYTLDCFVEFGLAGPGEKFDSEELCKQFITESNFFTPTIINHL